MYKESLRKSGIAGFLEPIFLESLKNLEISSSYLKLFSFSFCFLGVPGGYAPWRILNFNKKSEFPFL